MSIPNFKRFINWRATLLALLLATIILYTSHKDSGFISFSKLTFKRLDNNFKNKVDGILNVAPDKSEDSKIKLSRNETYFHQNDVDFSFFFVPPSTLQSKREVMEGRAKEVKGAFEFAWKSYKENAWGHDNLLPITKGASDSWQRWGITLVDSLDSLLILDMKQEYSEALKFVEKIDFTKGETVNFFETTIRYLGGLLAAYDLNGDKILVEKATVLADKLILALETKTGIPSNMINFKTGEITKYGKTLLAELGSFQLEFTRLSQITGNKVYAQKAQKVIDIMDKMKLEIPGFYPLTVDKETGEASSSTVSFGGMADSFYEYLLKMYLQTDNKLDQYKRMYEQSIDSMHQYLLSKLDNNRDNLVLLGRIENNRFKYDMDHLSCFVPGMLMLGGANLNRLHDIVVGLDLTYTCYQFYQATKTKLSAETYKWYPTQSEFEKQTQKWTNLKLSKDFKDYKVEDKLYNQTLVATDTRYLLRPETVESIFYAFRITGNPIYQDWGYEIFQAIQKHCKVEFGYAEVKDVNSDKMDYNDSMESFFLAETLKYLYLLFSPPDKINLNNYLFTTEAHPIKIIREEKK